MYIEIEREIKTRSADGMALVELLAARQARASTGFGLIFAGVLIGFFILIEVFPDSISFKVFGGCPVGWILGVAMLVMAGGVTILFNWYSRTVLDPLKKEARAILGESEKGTLS